jgi:hypothetical protein
LRSRWRSPLCRTFTRNSWLCHPQRQSGASFPRLQLLSYERRYPAQTLLYQAVAQHW